MNEKFNKNTKVEQLTKMFLSRGEQKGLKDSLTKFNLICNSARTRFQFHAWKSDCDWSSWLFLCIKSEYCRIFERKDAVLRHFKNEIP